MRSVHECANDLEAKAKAAEDDFFNAIDKLAQSVEEETAQSAEGKSQREIEREVERVTRKSLARHTPILERVFSELVAHNSPEAVKAINSVVSWWNIPFAYRCQALEAIARMSHPSAGKALSKRKSFLSSCAPNVKEVAGRLLAEWNRQHG